MADEDPPSVAATDAAGGTDPWLDAMSDRSRDMVLGALVDFVERFNLGFDITLMVSGTIVTGSMISGAVYIDEMLAGMKGAHVGLKPDDTGLSKSIAQWFEAYRVLYEKPEDADENYRPPPRYYIHLKNTTVVAGHANINYEGVANWRCKLSEVDAFTLVRTRKS